MEDSKKKIVLPKSYSGPDVLKLGILIPNTGDITSQTAKSLAMLTADFTAWRPGPGDPKIKGSKLTVYMQSGSMLVQNRHDLVCKALQDDCSHVLFLDADMQFPRDTWSRLLFHGKSFIGCNCTTRNWPVTTTAHDKHGRPIDSSRCEGIESVQHIGLAVSLIECALLKRLEPPLFMMEWIPNVGAYCGEDIYFCAKVQGLDEQVWVEHDLSKEIKHIGKQDFGYGLIGANEVMQKYTGSRKETKRYREDPEFSPTVGDHYAA